MKLVNRSIDIIASFRADEPPEPIRFRVKDRNDKTHVLKVDNILDISKGTKGRNEVWYYKCQGRVGGSERIYVLEYDISKTNWFLVKI